MSDHITDKPYAAIRELHAPSDAVLAMRHEHPFDPEDFSHIDMPIRHVVLYYGRLPIARRLISLWIRPRWPENPGTWPESALG